MKHKCTACGHEDEINPGKLLGAIRTPKREAAWKKHGERLKTMYANARKVHGNSLSFEQRDIIDNPEPRRPYPADFIAPNGSFTKEDLKAMIQGVDGRIAATSKLVKTSSTLQGIAHLDKMRDELSEVPHAPFDFEQDCERYRVRAEKTGLGLYWVGEDGEVRKRSLEAGELETLWEKRIK